MPVGFRFFLRVARSGLGFGDLELGRYSPPEVARIWLWVYYNKVPIYPIFYLLKGGYRALGFGAAQEQGDVGDPNEAVLRMTHQSKK